MLNWTLYKREMKGSLKMLLIFAAVISMYVAIIISMYDPKTMATLDHFYEVMPELMAAVGIKSDRLYDFVSLRIYSADFSYDILHSARKRPHRPICGQRLHGNFIGGTRKTPDSGIDTDVCSHKRNYTASCLCNRPGTGNY